MSDVKGKAVAITGASSGIGEAAARSLAAAGAKIVLGARRLDRLETIAAAMAYAIGQPSSVDVNEILIRPTAQPN